MYPSNPNIGEADIGLNFRSNLGYIARLCLKIKSGGGRGQFTEQCMHEVAYFVYVYLYMHREILYKVIKIVPQGRSYGS
jgi:hypothetical protein